MEPIAADEVLAVVVACLREVTGCDAAWAEAITPATTLEGDLQLESIDMVSVNDLLRQRYGVDLTEFIAGLDINHIIGLTVADVVAHIQDAASKAGRRA